MKDKTNTEQKIREAYKDFINQFPEDKISFENYKKDWLKMEKEIKDSNEKEQERLSLIRKQLNEAINLIS